MEGVLLFFETRSDVFRSKCRLLGDEQPPLP
jgi:hypothetical protein